jgi:hypothetical protein
VKYTTLRPRECDGDDPFPFFLSTRMNQKREMERIRFLVFPSCANPKGRESLEIYIYMKKKRDFFFSFL